MNSRPSIVVAFATGVLCSALVAWSSRPGVARQATDFPTDDAGRYRIAVSENGAYAFVIDTVTGHCWRRDGNAATNWGDLGTPAGSAD